MSIAIGVLVCAAFLAVRMKRFGVVSWQQSKDSKAHVGPASSTIVSPVPPSAEDVDTTRAVELVQTTATQPDFVAPNSVVVSPMPPSADDTVVTQDMVDTELAQHQALT